jgi:hypothetical protein
MNPVGGKEPLRSSPWSALRDVSKQTGGIASSALYVFIDSWKKLS